MSTRPPVVVSSQLTQAECVDGSELINQYLVLEDICPGRVKLCYDQDAQELRAMKLVRRPARVSRNALQEIAIWKKLRHKNIVTLHEIIDDPESQTLFLVMQHVEKGALVRSYPAVADGGISCDTIEPFHLIHFARQICAGLGYLHRHGVVHNDLKPANILRGRDDQVYLADFGVSEILGNQATSDPDDDSRRRLSAAASSSTVHDDFLSDEETPLGQSASSVDRFYGRAVSTGSPSSPQRHGVGTPAFFAPEMMDPTRVLVSNFAADRFQAQFELGKAGDVWALGVTFFMMLAGYLPCCPKRQALELSPSEGSGSWSMSSSSRGKATYWDQYRRATLSADPVRFPPTIPPGWRSIIAAMLAKDYRQRPDIEAVRMALKNLDLSESSDVIPISPSSQGSGALRGAPPSHSVEVHHDPMHGSLQGAPSHGPPPKSPHGNGRVTVPVAPHELTHALSRVRRMSLSQASTPSHRREIFSAASSLTQLPPSMQYRSLAPSPREVSIAVHSLTGTAAFMAGTELRLPPPKTAASSCTAPRAGTNAGDSSRTSRTPPPVMRPSYATHSDDKPLGKPRDPEPSAVSQIANDDLNATH